MRGKPDTPTVKDAVQGITPAGAGKTFVKSFISPILWDHPRRCGENVDTGIEKLEIAGSPPQVRGKPLLPQNGHGLSGITPAGAGKTLPARRFLPSTEDHPRRCGENLGAIMITATNQGSPPQVRGKLRSNHDYSD